MRSADQPAASSRLAVARPIVPVPPLITARATLARYPAIQGGSASPGYTGRMTRCMGWWPPR